MTPKQLTFFTDHPLGACLPRVDLYPGNELVMSQPGAHSLAFFLTPDQALQLAEALVHEARAAIATKAAQ